MEIVADINDSVSKISNSTSIPQPLINPSIYELLEKASNHDYGNSIHHILFCVSSIHVY
jgi:hypothetical protein